MFFALNIIVLRNAFMEHYEGNAKRLLLFKGTRKLEIFPFLLSLTHMWKKKHCFGITFLKLSFDAMPRFELSINN